MTHCTNYAINERHVPPECSRCGEPAADWHDRSDCNAWLLTQALLRLAAALEKSGSPPNTSERTT